MDWCLGRLRIKLRVFEIRAAGAALQPTFRGSAALGQPGYFCKQLTGRLCQQGEIGLMGNAAAVCVTIAAAGFSHSGITQALVSLFPVDRVAGGVLAGRPVRAL